MSFSRSYLPIFTLFALLAAGCGSDGTDDGGNEEEVITTVTMTFTPDVGGPVVVAAFDDPDGDGGDPPTIDNIALSAQSYALAITFENRLEDPAEDITQEIADEDGEHQIFLTGTAVDGPANEQAGAPLTHTYSDADENGNPVGLVNAIAAASGTGILTVTLRHLPPIAGTPQKDAELAAAVRTDGLSSIGGNSDVQVNFDVTVP